MNADMYQQFFNALDEVFCVIEVIFDDFGKPVDWRYLETNQQFALQIGIPNAVGQLISEIDPYTEQYWFDFCGDVAITGNPARMENKLKGMEKWFDVYAFKIGEPESRTIGVLFRDLTARKQIEDELKESEQKAHALVRELEEAANNKNHFISVLSHELRNPLAVIVGNLSILELDNSPEQISRSKEIVNRQIVHLTKLVDDLMDFTRINQNKIQLKQENIDLVEILRNVSLDFRPQFMARSIRLTTHLPVTPVFLRADPVRITQCIGNLLQNAHKFTRENGKVSLSLATKDGHAVIRVTDNGIGIDSGLLAHIFEPFTQADASIDRPNSGLGLGLSITNSIVRLHGGSVSVQSDGNDRGSVFTIRLPITDSSVKLSNDAVGQKSNRAFTILLIDDNQSLTDVMCPLLNLMGHQTHVANNGVDGLAKAQKIRPDIVFCDIGLPGINGYDVAKALRTNATLQGIYLVALSGYAHDTDIEEAKEAGFDRYLVKPVDQPTLNQVFAEIG